MPYFKACIPVMICILSGCGSPSEKVLNEFNKVNEGLEKAGKMADSLLQPVKFAGLDKKAADSLESIFNKASFYVTRAKMDLESADQKGEDLGIAEKLIIRTSTGDSLYQYMMAIYDVGIRYGDSSMQRTCLLSKEPAKDQWLRKYFYMIPTVAAKTILSKFQNDLIHIKMGVDSASDR